MRLLLINPNTTGAFAERLAASARAVLPDKVDLMPASVRREGFP